MGGFNPKVTNGRVDPLLSNILLTDVNEDFIADKLLPTVPNLKDETGVIGSVGDAHLRQYETKRSIYDTGEHRISFEISKDDTYRIDHHDLSIYLPDRLIKQLQSPFNARQIAQKTAMDGLRLEREIGLAALMTSTAILTNNQTLSLAADKYTDPVNSTPELDFDTARDSVQGNTGLEANAVLMNREVANTLRRHPWFLSISHSTLQGGAGKLRALSMSAFVETLKAWYDLDFVFIGKQIKVTTKEGQTATKDGVWGNDVVFFRRPMAPSLMTPSFGYSFQLAGKNLSTRVRREPKAERGELVEVDWAFQDKILNADAAFLLKDVI